MKALLFSPGAALLLLATAGPASAAIITETYTGTVQNGSSYDLTGLFGAPSPNRGALDDDAFRLVFTLDTAAGAGSFSDAGGQFQSGLAYGTAQAVSASIAINGFTHEIFGTWFGTEIRNNNPSAGLSSLDTSLEDTGYGSARAMITVFNTAVPGDILTPFTFDPAAQSVFTTASGSFNIGQHSNEAGGGLDIASVTVAISAVPLPAALPMFGSALVGFGACRLLTRKRRTVAVAG